MSPASTPPHLDVVVVTYRCADALGACLADLARQRVDVRLDVCVVDNASGDGTADAADRAGWVTVIRNPVNAGFAVAANRGLAGGRAPVALVLNPDTRIPEGALRACLDHLAAHPDVGVLTPAVMDRAGTLDGRCLRGMPTVPAALAFMTGADRRAPRLLGGYTGAWRDPRVPADVMSVSGAVMFLRRAALADAGPFDEGYFMYAEDMDLCLRIARHGWRVRYWPGATMVHHGGGSGRPPVAETAFHRSMSRFTRLHRRGARNLPARVTVRCASELALAWRRLGRRVRRSPPTGH